MRRSQPYLAVTVLLAFSFVSVAQAQGNYVVSELAAPCLKLRAGPEADAEVLDCLSPGTLVTVVEAIPYWRKIRLADGRDGWVAKKFLKAAEPQAPQPTPIALPSDAWLEVHFVDVGQGDGIWIHTFDDGIDGNGVFEGRNIVIDGGPDASDTKNAMRKYLEAAGHHNAILDALIVTHPHNDHYPGAEGLLRHFDVRKYYDPGYPKGGTAYPSFLDAVRDETASGQPAKVMLGRQQFDALDWGSEVQAEILYSYPGNPAGLGTKANTVENNASLVLRLQYGNHSFLFMGDAEGKDRSDSPNQARYVERILLDSVPGKLKSTVLKVAHHGSETSSSLAFLQAVDPDIVVVCSGRKSFSGTFIPDDSTLRRYCCHNPNIRLYRTDQNDQQEGRTAANDADGDHVVIRTNGTTLEVKAFSSGQPFAVSSCKPACQP